MFVFCKDVPRFRDPLILCKKNNPATWAGLREIQM
jgi:hypothetical protein